MNVVLALFGFAKTDVQRSTPPIFAYLMIFPVSYWRAEIVEFLYRMLGEYGTYILVPGTLCTALFFHAVVRAIVFKDDLSWGGWFRSLWLRVSRDGSA